MAAAASAPLRVRVHYDFASSLCYVAHCVMQRMSGTLAELEIALVWSPLDLARLVGPYRPGAEISETRRENARRVARELDVALNVPRIWPDSSGLNAAAFAAERLGRGATWRERIFSALFEQGELALGDEDVLELARQLSLPLDARDLARGRRELELKTELAREEQVSGVPTFMLGTWPFGGIQSDDTMRRVLARYAEKLRAGEIHE
ncbi:MAG TPA: DsbA family protein [Myxococcota bacterium]|jgi:predicted DsbA family dithiol-disulfide isomerase